MVSQMYTFRVGYSLSEFYAAPSSFGRKALIPNPKQASIPKPKQADAYNKAAEQQAALNHRAMLAIKSQPKPGPRLKLKLKPERQF